MNLPEGHTSGSDSLRLMGVPDNGIRDLIHDASTGLTADDCLVDAWRNGRNARTSISVRTGPTWRTIEYVLPAPDSAAFSRAVAALPTSLRDPGWPRQAIRFAKTQFRWDNSKEQWWRTARPDLTPTYVHGVPPEVIAVGAGAVWFLGRFAGTYISKIAEWLAESTIETAKRIKHRKQDSQNIITIEVPGGTTLLMLPESIPDEAREAFLDLDPLADGIRGKALRWEPSRRAWVPIEPKDVPWWSLPPG